MGRDLPSGTVTFLFTDVEGSTKLLHALKAWWAAQRNGETRELARAGGFDGEELERADASGQALTLDEAVRLALEDGT